MPSLARFTGFAIVTGYGPPGHTPTQVLRGALSQFEVFYGRRLRALALHLGNRLEPPTVFKGFYYCARGDLMVDTDRFKRFQPRCTW